MQTIGYITVNGKQVLVLARYHKTHVTLKIRKTGSKGHHFSDEEIHITEEQGKLADLMSGKVIKC